MDEIIFADKEFSLFLNGMHSEVWDKFFHITTSTIIWLPLFAVLLWMVLRRQGGRGLMTVIVVALIILVADQFASGLLKHTCCRLRPSHDPVMQYLVHTVCDYRGGLYGFASSHAANTFALASFFTLVVRNGFMSFSLIIWALINSYGRIYQGVHYFGDVLAGALIGIVVARLAYEVYLHLVLHFFVIPHHNKWTLKAGLAESFGKSEPTIVSYTFWLTIILIAILIKLTTAYYGATC